MLANLRCFVLVFLLVLISATTVLADDLLTVHLSGPCDNPVNYAFCDLNAGLEGRAATGVVTVTNNPWSATFKSDLPTQWTYNNDNYNATFGPGGTFQMTGPDNLTFTGEITSGSSEENTFYGNESLDMLFAGYWSNSEYAYGEITIATRGDFGDAFTLDVYTVPEPASLTLLAGGIAAVCGAFRRYESRASRNRG